MQEEPDKYHLHEALDRVHVIICNFNEHVLTHPSIVNNKEFRTLSYEIEDNLLDLYRKIGEVHLK